MHRPIKLIEAAGTPIERITHTTYTPTGLKAQVIKPASTIEYQYDAFSNMTELKSSDLRYTYTYDKLGRLIKAQDHTGLTTTRSWDAHGNLLSETLANGYTLSSTYDGENRRTSLTYPDGSKAEYSYIGPYLKTVTYKGDSREFTRDLSGRVISETTPEGPIYTQFDPRGMPKQIKSSLTYTIHQFDPRGNPLKTTLTTEDDSYQSAYAYDALNQLVTDEENLTYDSNHNRTADKTTSYAFNNLNQIEDLPYDANGNLLSYNGQNYTYDSLDRLASVDGITFTYDPLNRRMSAGSTTFYYDGLNEIGSPTEKRILTTATGSEIGSTAFIELGSTIYTPMHDPFGNIISLLNHENYAYTAFGKHTLSQNPWRYQSKRDDPSGLIYFGKRYYIPSLGRWLTPDPEGFIDTQNLYQYAFNNPFHYHDPYGESARTAIQGAGEITLGLALIASGAFLEVATCGGYTFALGVHASAGLALITHGSMVALDNPKDLRLRSPKSSTKYDPYYGYNPSINGMDPEEYEYWQQMAKQETTDVYHPDRPLPKKPHGEPQPETDAPHTQLGKRQGRHGAYPQAREFDSQGRPVRDIDFTDHARPTNHLNPHQHSYDDPPTGGTRSRDTTAKPVEGWNY